MQIEEGLPRARRVLVCEDNMLMAEVVCEFLQECGLTPVGPAGHVETAMLFAQTEPLDGAILDINLHGRLCFPICCVLSARRIPFMFLTGHESSLVPAGFRDTSLITKPFEATEMKKALGQMLGVTESAASPADKIVWH